MDLIKSQNKAWHFKHLAEMIQYLALVKSTLEIRPF